MPHQVNWLRSQSAMFGRSLRDAKLLQGGHALLFRCSSWPSPFRATLNIRVQCRNMRRGRNSIRQLYLQ
jgi:hypothetical protein